MKSHLEFQEYDDLLVKWGSMELSVYKCVCGQLYLEREHDDYD